MKRIPLFLLISFIAFSCNSKQDTSYSMMAEEAGYDAAPAVAEAVDDGSLPDVTEQPDPAKKKIIKDGRLSIRVTNLEETKKRVDSLLTKYKGYYAKESQHNTNYESTFNLKIRVPVANYEKLVSDIESGNGKILFKEVDARDVTDQFVDIETRLANKRTYLARYRELVKQAKNIKEVLEVEEQIRKLEEEIESAEGRLKYLGDQVAYSTLDLTLSKQLEYKYDPGQRAGFFERLKKSLSSGWHGFVDFFLFVIELWPFWIAAGLLIYLWRKIRIKRRIKKLE